MEDSPKRSKRASLRFSVDSYRLRYKTEFEDGTAYLDNISAGGCAMREVSAAVELHEKILLILLCENDEQIEIGGVVVRVVDNGAAVRFTQLSESNKQKIVVFFAKLQRRQKTI